MFQLSDYPFQHEGRLQTFADFKDMHQITVNDFKQMHAMQSRTNMQKKDAF